MIVKQKELRTVLDLIKHGFGTTGVPVFTPDNHNATIDRVVNRTVYVTDYANPGRVRPFEASQLVLI
jgi:hypothetical protein